MAVKILTDPDKGYQCLYCSTTMQVFGPIFYLNDEEDAQDFLDWLAPLDARCLSLSELDQKRYDWLRAKESEETQTD
jgi:hypothetical protein